MSSQLWKETRKSVKTLQGLLDTAFSKGVRYFILNALWLIFCKTYRLDFFWLVFTGLAQNSGKRRFYEATDIVKRKSNLEARFNENLTFPNKSRGMMFTFIYNGGCVCRMFVKNHQKLPSLERSTFLRSPERIIYEALAIVSVNIQR